MGLKNRAQGRTFVGLGVRSVAGWRLQGFCGAGVIVRRQSAQMGQHSAKMDEHSAQDVLKGSTWRPRWATIARLMG